MSDTQITSSVNRAAKAITGVGGKAGPYVRAPKGARDLRVLERLGAGGYTSVRWTTRPAGGVAEAIKSRVMKGFRPGTIVSLDVWRRSHRKAALDIAKALQRRGYDLKSVDGLKHATPVRWDVTTSQGSSGGQVKLLQKRLRLTSYVAGNPDGNFNDKTLQGVYAFEKSNRLARDGVVTPAQLTQILTSKRPKTPKHPGKRYIHIDVSKQILYEVHGGRVFKTIPVSTGNEEYYEIDGERYKAHTPRGSYTVVRKIPGKRVSRLGELWWPNYYVGGYAIHGSPSVPTYPASHGCVRIPMFVTQSFYERNPVGVPVYVQD